MLILRLNKPAFFCFPVRWTTFSQRHKASTWKVWDFTSLNFRIWKKNLYISSFSVEVNPQNHFFLRDIASVAVLICPWSLFMFNHKRKISFSLQNICILSHRMLFCHPDYSVKYFHLRPNTGNATARKNSFDSDLCFVDSTRVLPPGNNSPWNILQGK